MKIYTRTGDAGETALFGAGRVRKDSARIEAFGAVDELNAFLGRARAEAPGAEVESLLASIQNELFNVGAILATPEPERMGVAPLAAEAATSVEAAIDRFEAELPPLKQFILPAGSRAAAELHVARAVCRRAERRVVTLAQQEPVDPQIVIYLNRLSDLLFVLARYANQAAGGAEVFWRKNAE